MVPKNNVDLEAIRPQLLHGGDIIIIPRNYGEDIAKFSVSIGIASECSHDAGINLLFFIVEVAIMCDNLKTSSLSNIPNCIVGGRSRTEKHRTSYFSSISASDKFVELPSFPKLIL